MYIIFVDAHGLEYPFGGTAVRPSALPGDEIHTGDALPGDIIEFGGLTYEVVSVVADTPIHGGYKLVLIRNNQTIDYHSMYSGKRVILVTRKA